MPLFGPPNIEKLKAKNDIEGLINALSYPKDAEIRRRAAEALGTIGITGAWVIMAEEQLSIVFQRDIDSTVRQNAADALGKIGDARALECLIPALKDRSKDVRQHTVWALEKLGWQPDRSESGAWYWATKQDWKKCVHLGALAVEPLVTALKDRDINTRRYAAQALAQIGLPAVKALSEVLAYPDRDVRMIAATTLVKIGPAVVKPLSTVYKQGQIFRDEYYRVLASIGNNEATELIIAEFGESEKRHTQGDIEIHSQFGDTEAMPEFFPEIVKRNIIETHRSQVDALVNIGASATLSLVAALREEDDHVRRGAAETLEKIGWQPGRDEEGALFWIVKEDWEKCVEIGLFAVDPLISAFCNGNNRVCEGASHALIKIGRPAVVSLIAALSDSHDCVRWNASKVLGEIGDRRAIEPLIKNLIDEKFNCYYAEALCKFGGSAVDPLIAALKVSHDWGRDRITAVLSRIGLPAVEPLILVLIDSDEYARWHAARALADIGWQPESDEIGALYWASRGEWEKCIGVGEAACEALIAALKHHDFGVRHTASLALGNFVDPRVVKPLIDALSDRVLPVRQAAACSLVTLYQQSRLGEIMKQEILAQRSRIIQSHVDEIHGGGSCGFEPTTHTDIGIGVDFPL